MDNFLFSLEAVTSILSECFHAGNNLETGGILIGPDEHRSIVTDTIPSSAFAERKTCTYYQSEEDVRILNRKLKEYQEKGYEFLGYWHRHPMNMCELSFGDIETCSDILQNPNYKINNSLLMSIITESHNSFPIFSYIVCLDSNGEVAVEEVSVKVMPKSCIEKFIEKGENNESDCSGHDCEEIEEQGTDNTLRPSGKQDCDSKLPDKEGVAEDSRNFLPGERELQE
jgi:hypothetical protein